MEEDPSRGHDERKKNLLILASGLWIGGAEMVIGHLARTVDRARFAVTVAHLKSRGQIGEALLREGIEVISLMPNEHETVEYLSFLRLRRLLRERKIDVVHTHTTQGLVDAVICKLLGSRVRIIHTFHFGNYPHTRSRIKWLERVFSRGADRLFAVGSFQRRQLQKLYGLRDDEIGTLWNGVAPPVVREDSAFLGRLNVGSRIVVGTIATLIEQKGLTDLLDVARRLRDARHDVLFVIVGDGPLRTQLEARRRELGLEDSVVLAGWITNAADVALPVFDIFFQPSLWEAMSVVLLEAMASGKAIVTTRVGEAPSVIQHGVSGLLVDPKDISGMTEALGSLIEDYEARIRMGKAARDKWERHFTVEHMARAYEVAYVE